MPTSNPAPYDGDEQGFTSIYTLQKQARAMDADAFVAAFPMPALVPDTEHLETTEPDTEDEASGVQLLTIAVGGMGVLRYLNKIGFLRKRPGNPYAHLISIGRSATNDLVVALDTVTKVHGYFVHGNGIWQFTDRGSTNGSRLNDKPLVAGQPMDLDSGDRLQLGHDVTFSFLYPEALYRHVR